jgi:hypothetical protein
VSIQGGWGFVPSNAPVNKGFAKYRNFKRPFRTGLASRRRSRKRRFRRGLDVCEWDFGTAGRGASPSAGISR